MSVGARPAALAITDLRKTFPEFSLGPLTLTFTPGRIYGLLGPNGAGKTTLLNLIALQLHPTGGSMHFGDAPVVWGDTVWKSRLTYIRESPAFYDELTVGQTIALASRLYDRFDLGSARTLLDRLGLLPSKKVGTLSKGSKVKLGLAVALAHDAAVVMLDEPTAGLDPTVRSDVQDIIADIVTDRPATTVLLSSHIFEDAERVADEVLFLRNGRIAHAMPVADLDALVVCRVDDPQVSLPAGIQLVWRRHGERFCLVARGSKDFEALMQASPCTVRADRTTLADVYLATEGAS